MTKFLMRLDDASEFWNASLWERMHYLLEKYEVKPLVAVIPDVKDQTMLSNPEDQNYLQKINDWVNEGWEPCLHGCTHKIFPVKGGLNPIHTHSEFVGLSLNEQKQKIAIGYNALREKILGKTIKVFIAPCHTFDKNTLEALRQETDIRIISDTVANNIYYQEDFYYIPQQSGIARNLPLSLVTFCYHPNTMKDTDFLQLEMFLEQYSKKFISFKDIHFYKRKKNIYDKLLQKMYLLKSGY